MNKPIIILANGNFPKHEIPLKILKKAQSIICCDGSINNLIKYGLEPISIVGDLDSLNEKYKIKYQKKLFHIPDQHQNDLRKSMQWVDKQNIDHATILGATGKREDHSLGNIFSLIEFQTKTKFDMITDHGIFTTLENEQKLKSFKGEQVSIFSTNPTIKITTSGLKYNLNDYTINSIYSCTLNESIKSIFTIKISHGKVIVYQAFKEK
tara:strand:- start:234 stop:860 length:627 start_codon:yes stop_codon:yes gene_type:complete